MKSTVDQIRQRFDNDVERFSNLETGQSATIDAPLVLDLITAVAAATNPRRRARARHRLRGGQLHGEVVGAPARSQCDADRSEQAHARSGLAADWRRDHGQHRRAARRHPRHRPGPDPHYDIIMAAAVFHHLRDDAEWEAVFGKCYAALKPGGSLWISDLIAHDDPAVQAVMWQRYGEYLTQLKGEAYRDQVFGYIEQEDTPRPLLYQLHLLKQVGFRSVEVLHKNAMFAAFGGIK